MDLHAPVKTAGKFFSNHASALEKLGIVTFYDFLYHLPARYEDYSRIVPIASAPLGETITIQGTVKEIKNQYLRGGKKLQKATITDETGELEVIWFNQQFIPKIMQPGDKVSLAGRMNTFSGKPKMESPEYELLTTAGTTIHTGRLVPVYPETHGITSKWLRRQIYKILKEQKENILEHLPDSIIEHNKFFSLYNAIEQVHFPEKYEHSLEAKKRLAYEELFFIHLATLERKKTWATQQKSQAFTRKQFEKDIATFQNTLPFTLTSAQQKAIQEIFNDLQQEKPMNRLVEGDVGSGKTIIATIAMYFAHLNGFQSVLMAPTEILAQQHYATLSKFLSPLGVRIGLATGSSKYYVSSSMYKDKKETHNTKYMLHDTDILVGTHAVLSEKINFNNLGLVVIDEQQRFGVAQRGIIRQKGKNPHLLTMTATPIPRTIALTLYGDLDLSYLDEMPKGRKPIKTWLVPKIKRNGAYDWIRKQVVQGDQVFIICPFIEESETMQTIKAANKEFERLTKDVFPDLKIGLLHGKLKSKEKDVVLQEFKDKKFDILVATPVVEVGIDIQNATIIMIEASERFGLAQLHQLRGRVGRGDKQSYCLLFTESTNPQTLERLKAMETMHVGAQLAELDLKLRGPGDMYGTQQHGTKLLKIASFSDFPLIEKTKKEAMAIFPKLSEHTLLQEKLKKITVAEVSPD